MRMNRLIATVTVVSVGFLGLPAVNAGDVEQGKKLYDQHCQGCHDTRIHTRPNRIIHTYGDLINRVKFCDAQVKAGFDDAQLKAVAEYLNTNFYKFIKE